MAAIDPVCGMSVEEDSAAATYEYEGVTYYFCAVDCAKGPGGMGAEQLLAGVLAESAGSVPGRGR